MTSRFVVIPTFLLTTFCIVVAADAAPLCRGSKIFTHCTDNVAELQAQCMVYENGSAFYHMCMANATAHAVHSCQRYRVPCSYEGTFFENLNLSRYPAVGAPTPLQPGPAPLDIKGSLLGTLFHLY